MGVGQREKATQKRVIKLFAQELGYTYLGDFTERKNSNIETELLTKFLTRKGYSPVLISRALKELQDAAGDQSVNLYDLNEQTYKKLRYGVKVSESVGQHKITVQFVDWEHPLENDLEMSRNVQSGNTQNLKSSAAPVRLPAAPASTPGTSQAAAQAGCVYRP